LKKFLFCAICILGLLFGWGMAKFLSPSPVILQKTVAKSSPFPAHSEPVILENTRLMVRYSYGGCGHYELKEKRLPSSWIGKSASDVSLTGTLFETYENNILYFAKISQEKCNRHFILTIKNNQLIVQYQNDPSRIRDCYDFLPQLLPQEELEKLKAGIEIESEEELTRLLEDYCS